MTFKPTMPGFGDPATWGPVIDPRDPRFEDPCDRCRHQMCEKCDLYRNEPDGDQYEERKLQDD